MKPITDVRSHLNDEYMYTFSCKLKWEIQFLIQQFTLPHSYCISSNIMKYLIAVVVVDVVVVVVVVVVIKENEKNGK